MSEYEITIESGTSKRLSTAGKYCDRDIVIIAGGESEGVIGTWVLNDTIEKLPSGTYDFEFSSNGTYFEAINFGTLGPPLQVMRYLGYTSNLAYSFRDTSSYGVEPGWQNDEYKTLNVIKEPSEEVATWLKANGKKKKVAYNEIWQYGYDAGYNRGYAVGFDEGYQANEEILSELMEWSIVTYSSFCYAHVYNKHPTKYLIATLNLYTEEGYQEIDEYFDIYLPPNTDDTFGFLTAITQGAEWDINITGVRFSEDET